MIRRLIILLLIVGCAPHTWEDIIILSKAPKVRKQTIKILDLCRPECNNNTKYSDEWCDCMQLCSNNVNDERHSLVKIAKSLEGNTFIEKWMDGKGIMVSFENGTYKITQESCPCSIDSTNHAIMKILGNPIDTTDTN